MKATIIILALWCAITLHISSGESGEQDGRGKLTSSLFVAELADGSHLVLRTAELFVPTKGVVVPIHAVLYPRDRGGRQGASVWETQQLTTLDYAPPLERYYALVKEMRGEIFIFFTWNGQHCTIDKRTGQRIKKGEDDEIQCERTSIFTAIAGIILSLTLTLQDCGMMATGQGPVMV